MRRGLLAHKEEMAALRDRIGRRPFDMMYDALRKRCSLILETSPLTEMHWRTMWQQGIWGSAVSAARTTQGRIMDLLIAHHIDHNQAYRNRAAEELKTLVGWSTWNDPCYNGEALDLCTAEAGVAATVGVDWLWEDLAEVDRIRVLHALRHRVIAPYCKAVDKGAWWYNCYHHWNAVMNACCGLSALLLCDEEHSSRDAYLKARAGLKPFFDALGREGGWDEGLGYWGYAMRYVLLLGEAAARTLDDQSLFHYRGMDATGLFPVYFTPNGHVASFGDLPVVPAYGAFYLLVKRFGQKDVCWWLDRHALHHDVTNSGLAVAGLSLLFRPADVEPVITPELQPLKVFHQIGWAAMADNWPLPEFYVAVKAGDMSANHGQRDMNSIQVQLGGEMLLTDPGSAPYNNEYVSGDRSRFYEVQACAHNTILVGQRDHAIDAQGTIIEAQASKNFRWLACDAGTACGPGTHFVRHLVMLVDEKTHHASSLVVLDEIHNPQPEPIEAMWHSAGNVELRPETLTGRFVGRAAQLHFAIASTVPLTAGVESRTVAGPHRPDNILRVQTMARGKVFIVTLLSRKALEGKIQIKQNSLGLKLKSGDIELHFKSMKRHLQLADVKQ